MTVNMKSDGFGLDDLRAVAKVAGLKRGLGDAILEQVTAAVRGWEGFATLDGVPELWARRVGANHRILID
jgi:serine/threonine-protein kinase HipA